MLRKTSDIFFWKTYIPIVTKVPMMSCCPITGCQALIYFFSWFLIISIILSKTLCSRSRSSRLDESESTHWESSFSLPNFANSKYRFFAMLRRSKSRAIRRRTGFLPGGRPEQHPRCGMPRVIGAHQISVFGLFFSSLAHPPGKLSPPMKFRWMVGTCH